MNTSGKRPILPVVLAAITLAACAPEATQGIKVTSTSSLTSASAATPSPRSTANPTEATQAAFAATSRAVSSYLATQGVPPDQIGPYSQATLQALGMLPIATQYPTATPFPVPFPVSTRVSQFGAVGYAFADPKDIQAARQAYEQYFDFISFRAGPPPDDLADALAQYLSPDLDTSDAKSDCGYSGVVPKILGLTQQGYYLRLTLQGGINWNDQSISLFVLPGEIEAVMGTDYTRNLLIEQVEITTGKVVKQKTGDLASTAYLGYDTKNGQWIVTRDDDGLYCHGIYFFTDN